MLSMWGKKATVGKVRSKTSSRSSPCRDGFFSVSHQDIPEKWPRDGSGTSLGGGHSTQQVVKMFESQNTKIVAMRRVQQQRLQIIEVLLPEIQTT